MCSPSSLLTTGTHLRVLEHLLSLFPLLYLHSLVHARFLSSTYTLAHVNIVSILILRNYQYP